MRIKRVRSLSYCITKWLKSDIERVVYKIREFCVTQRLNKPLPRSPLDCENFHVITQTGTKFYIFGWKHG